MSDDQLSAFLAKLNEDEGLQEKLKGAADLDAAVAMAQEAGFDVSKADWLKYQANQTLELSDEELEGISGGFVRKKSELWRNTAEIMENYWRNYGENMPRRTYGM
jgi:predicted ribosomally synthesized peptide with nif11-like leader